ncbi:hypothetical protein QVD17_19969 [Tagetes erecta]|uniref:Uncharacterized protein n=1 Tax=Tagetes erecta TaxID=13708 RepID=A0AAD8NXR8_TARER|nr:hypothetical protein QVD17_19969 [Tagetes erecta]
MSGRRGAPFKGSGWAPVLDPSLSRHISKKTKCQNRQKLINVNLLGEYCLLIPVQVKMRVTVCKQFMIGFV